MSDFYRLLAPFTGPSICSLLAGIGFHSFVALPNPVVGFLLVESL
jgi:hypothetical protein